MAGRYDHFVMRQYQATDAVDDDARASVLPAARRAIVAGVNTWAVVAARYHFSDVWRQQRRLVGEFLGTKNPEPPTLDAEGLRIKIAADKRHEIDKKRDEEVRKMEGAIFLRSRRSYAESAAAYMKLLGDLQEKVLRPKFLAYVKAATFAAKAKEHPPLRVYLTLSRGDFDAVESEANVLGAEVGDDMDLINSLYNDEDHGPGEILVDFEKIIMIGAGGICEDKTIQDLFKAWRWGDEPLDGGEAEEPLDLDVDEWDAFLPWVGVYAAAVPGVAKECGLQMKEGGRKKFAADGEKLGGGGRYLSYQQPSGLAEVFTFTLGPS